MSCYAEQDKRQPGAFVEALSIGISPSCHKLWPEKSENATITGNKLFHQLFQETCREYREFLTEIC